MMLRSEPPRCATSSSDTSPLTGMDVGVGGRSGVGTAGGIRVSVASRGTPSGSGAVWMAGAVAHNVVGAAVTLSVTVAGGGCVVFASGEGRAGAHPASPSTATRKRCHFISHSPVFHLTAIYLTQQTPFRIKCRANQPHSFRSLRSQLLSCAT